MANSSDDGYTPVYTISSWAEHWFTGVACAIFANILIFYTTRLYGRRLAIQRVSKEKRLQRQDSFFADPDEALPTRARTQSLTDGRIKHLAHRLLPPVRHRSAPSHEVEPSNTSKVSAQEPGQLEDPEASETQVAPPPRLPPSALITHTSDPIEHKTRTSDLVQLAILTILIQAFQFAALAIVSMALVAPLSCLFFVWWRVATLETARRKIRKEMSRPDRCNPVLYFASLKRALSFRFWSVVLTLVIANTLVIVGGPHEMYVVAVQKVVQLDDGLMVYITIVLTVIVIQGTLGQSKSTMELMAKWLRLKRVADLEPLILGINAGLLGGQYLLLVKLLAEIAEAAILLPEESTSGQVTFVLVIFALVVGVFHMQAWRRGMGLPRTRIFIPVYRMWYVISAIIASVLVLREFFDSSPAMIVVFCIGVAMNVGVIFVMARNALNAVRKDDFSTVIFLEEDPEQGIELPNNGQQRSPKRPRGAFLMNRRFANLPPPPDFRRSRSAPADPNARQARANSADSLLDGATPRSRRRISRHTPRPSMADHADGSFYTARNSHASMTPFFGPRRDSSDTLSRRSGHGYDTLHRVGMRPSRSSYMDDSDLESDGYESVGSFHSEPAESHPHAFHPFNPASPSSSSRIILDYEYTSPTSMIVLKGAFNPWAPQGQSFYFDCAAVPGNFKVRGPNYLEDGNKIKCDVSKMKLVMGEWLYNPETPVKNICNDPAHFVQREHVGRRNRPFLFVLNLMVPSVGNAVFTWCRRPNVEPDEVFERMLDEFVHHPDDEYRDKMFKIIPGVPEGSFIAKKAVGNKPAMICAKVPTSYYRGDNWFEVCVDCAQSRVAFSVMGAIKGFASGLTLQLGFLLESSTPETLPERLLGGITIVKPQMVPEPQPRPASLAHT